MRQQRESMRARGIFLFLCLKQGLKRVKSLGACSVCAWVIYKRKVGGLGWDYLFLLLSLIDAIWSARDWQSFDHNNKKMKNANHTIYISWSHDGQRKTEAMGKDGYLPLFETKLEVFCPCALPEWFCQWAKHFPSRSVIHLFKLY